MGEISTEIYFFLCVGVGGGVLLRKRGDSPPPRQRETIAATRKIPRMLASLRESLASHSSFFPNNSLLRHQLTKIKFLQQYGEVLNWWRLRRIPGIRRILSIPMRFLRKLFYLKKTFLSRNFSIEWLGNEDSSKESLESEESLASQRGFLHILFHFKKIFRITSFFKLNDMEIMTFTKNPWNP